MIRFCTRHYKIHILMKNFMVILLSIFSNFSVIASSPYNHHPSPAPILAFMSLYRLSPSQITSLPTLVITNHSLHRLWSLQTTLFTGFRPYKQLSSPALVIANNYLHRLLRRFLLKKELISCPASSASTPGVTIVFGWRGERPSLQNLENPRFGSEAP